MNFLLSSLLTLAIMFIILCLTTLRISIQSLKKDKNNHVQLRVTAWFKLIQYSTEIPIVKLKENLSGLDYEVKMKSPNQKLDQKKITITPSEILNFFQKLQNIINQIYALHLIAKRFLKGVHLERLEWDTTIGTGDASETGVLTGIGWGIKSSVIGLVTSYVTLRSLPKFNVQPSFQQKKLESKFVCMFRFRIGHAMLAGIRIVTNLRKRRDVKWQSTQFRV